MRIIGPAAAGIVIAVVGIGQAFFVTAAGFAISTLLIATLKLTPLEKMAKVLAGQWNRGIKPEKTYAETEQAIEKMIEKKLRIMAA